MSELTFLRPWWLFALLPALWFTWALWHRVAQGSDWTRRLPAAFQPYLLANNNVSRPAPPWSLVGLLLAWVVTITALSGPSWQVEEIPAQTNQTGVVIILDLSLSLYADDIKPNRISRVQFKLTDLLSQHPDWRVGMVAYAASAHLISPISDDNSTLLSLIPHLEPLIMPAPGADAVAGFRLAQQLLKGDKITQGHFIWITDDLEPEQVAPLQQQLQQSGASLSILVVGTELGGAIAIPHHGLMRDAQEQLIQAPVPLSRLAAFARDNQAGMVRLQLDDSDINSLRPNFLADTGDDDKQTLSQALDYGVYLLWLLVPLVALSARRGWIATWFSMSVLLPLLASGVSFAPTPVWANAEKPSVQLHDRWREMFLTPDQRGYQAWSQGDLVAAEREFNDPAWRGSVLYRQGEYEAAANAFAQDNSAQGHYNRGNALAQLNQLDAAQQAYETALKLNPQLASAQRNLDLVKQAKRQTPPPATPPSQTASDKKNDPSPSSSSRNEQPEQAEPGATESNAHAEQATQPNATSQTDSAAKESDVHQADNTDNTDNTDNNESSHRANEAKQADASATQAQQDSGIQTGQQTDEVHNPQAQTGMAEAIESVLNDDDAAQHREQQQANQAWLNQIRDEPGLFLKRKFDYQYQQSTPSKTTGKLW